MVDLSNVFAKPVRYKEIDIYPVKISDYGEFLDGVNCLLLDKYKLQEKDIQFLKMSYLRYLIELAVSNKANFFPQLKELFDLVIKQSFTFDEDDKGKIFIVTENQTVLSEKDFDNIKKIILEQNSIQNDTELRDPELEKKMQEAREFMEKKNGKMADLEQQIVAYHCAFGVSYEYIGNLTIYQFKKGIERMNLMKTADAIQAAQYSGFTDFKNPEKLPTWLSYIEEETNPDKDILMSEGEFKKFVADKGLNDK